MLSFDIDIVNKLKKTLDFITVRNNLTAANIANVDTPGYKAKDIKFEKLLARESKGSNELKLAATDNRHFGDTFLEMKPDVVLESSQEVRLDGNTVDVDKEMSKMAQSQIMYSSIVQSLNKKLKGIMFAIDEGRRG